jgi:putative FmdB family regulatory protein
MPLYEYKCKKCGHQFEKIQKFSDKMVKKCPDCGGPVEQTITAPAVQFKGSGWYVTDYAKKSTSPGSSGSGDSTSKDKSDDKSKSDGASKDSSSKEASSKESSPKESSSKDKERSSSSSSKESSRKGSGRHK